MLKDALRSLKRTPGFALVVSLTLGLGIGTSVTTFTVMQGVLWKPLPYPGAERLVLLNVAPIDTACEPNRLLSIAEAQPHTPP